MKKEFIQISVSDLIPYENNPRNNDEAVDDVAESMEQCGDLDPIEVDENNVILSGHTRLKAMLQRGQKTADVIRYTGLTEEQKKKYRLLANKTGEKSAWDFGKLEEELKDLDFNGFDFGFDLSTEEEHFDIEEDEIPEEAPTRCKKGEIWQLGDHRLMCGDSTNKDDVEKLMNGEKADMVFTDPPYNVAIGSRNEVLNKLSPANRNETEIENDNGMTDEEIGETLWKPSFVNMAESAKDDCSIYVTMPQGGTHMMMMMMMMSASWQVKHELMWLKNQPTFSLGRLDYDYKHEPIAYGWKKSHNFYGKGEFTKSVWEIDKPRESKLHPTMKPIELIVNALLNSSKIGNVVIDFFGGSGSTLIACEQTKRKCLMMELVPHYCDVIIERWENLTGKKAQKIG